MPFSSFSTVQDFLFFRRDSHPVLKPRQACAEPAEKHQVCEIKTLGFRFRFDFISLEV